MTDNGPKQNTQQPIVTGTSVIAVKFKDGVVMAADNLGPFYLHRHLKQKLMFSSFIRVSSQVHRCQATPLLRRVLGRWLQRRHF